MSDAAASVLGSVATDLGLTVEYGDWGASLRGHLAIIRAVIEPLNEDTAFVYFVCRTTSWDWPGERTDLHDVIAVLTACFASSRGQFSFFLQEVENPAVRLPGEIYMRRLFVGQPSGGVYRLRESEAEALHFLLGAVYYGERVFWWHLRAADHSWEDHEIPPTDPPPEWTSRASSALALRSQDNLLSTSRILPPWYYARDLRSSKAVLRSPIVARMLRDLCPLYEACALETREGIYLRVGSLQYFIGRSLERRVRKVLRELDDPPLFAAKTQIIPLDNYAVAVGEDHVAFLPASCGREEYQQRSQKRLQVAARDSRFLLGPMKFQWVASIPPERFEALVSDLLRASRRVSWIRQVGATTERDRGRDFIAEWAEPGRSGADEPVAQIKSVVVQCKVRQGTVGVADVHSILDLLEVHQAGGYFLAVSTQLSTNLTDTLWELRRRGRWFIDWWTRLSIEDELRAHPEVATAYADIVGGG